MGLFQNMLGNNETLFKNEVALDFSFQPKLIKHREKEQFIIAGAVKPLFQQRSGRNLLLFGKPGIGKTVAVRHVFRELEEEYDEVLPIYINCWLHNSTYKIALELSDLVGNKFIQNKKTPELFKEVLKEINKTSVVFAFDEIDKVEDFDFLYTLLEGVYRKTIILISNYREWLLTLDERVKSRLSPELLAFKEYTSDETKDILHQRREFAFPENAMPDDAFAVVVERAFSLKDIRSGLHLMKEAAYLAEDDSSRLITKQHVERALKKLDELTLKADAVLDEEHQFIMNLVKLHNGKKMKEIFDVYQQNGGKSSYRTFHRKIAHLRDGQFVLVKKSEGGADGTTSQVFINSVKKLMEF